MRRAMARKASSRLARSHEASGGVLVARVHWLSCVVCFLLFLENVLIVWRSNWFLSQDFGFRWVRLDGS